MKGTTANRVEMLTSGRQQMGGLLGTGGRVLPVPGFTDCQALATACRASPVAPRRAVMPILLIMLHMSSPMWRVTTSSILCWRRKRATVA